MRTSFSGLRIGRMAFVIIMNSEADITPTPNLAQKNNLSLRAAIIGAAFVLAEVSPANEALRAASFGAAEKLSNSIVVPTLSVAATSLFIELLASLSARPFINHAGESLFNADDSNSGNSLVARSKRKMSERLKRYYDKTKKNNGRLSSISASVFMGSVLGLLVKRVANPDREVSVKDCVVNSSAVASLSGGFALAGSEGIDSIGFFPSVIVGSTVLGLGLGIKKISSDVKNRRTKRKGDGLV